MFLKVLLQMNYLLNWFIIWLLEKKAEGEISVRAT